MESYAAVLNYAIPFFLFLILLEYMVGRWMGVKTIRSMDTISSLSSGLTNIVRDVLGLSVAIISYDYMVRHWAFFDIKATWLLYVLAFVGKDFAGYWTHRFEHVVNVFWNRHIIHHSSEEFNLACALRQEVSGLIGIFFFLYIPLAILGIPTEVMAIVIPLQLFAQFWYHTTLIRKMGWLEYVLVTPSHHRVHHAINDEYLDKNFSQIFIIWDKIFGTFQEELDEVPAVYGVKKPVQTWNPFLINYIHLWQMAKDAWHTRKLWDKLRIWFMPTGWRPADVQKKFPIAITTDPYHREKYDTPAPPFFQVWHWVQLVVTLLGSFYLFSHIAAFVFTDVLLYGGFIGLTVFSYTTLMDRKPYAVLTELLRMAYGFALMYKMGGWFGLDSYWGYGNYAVAGYFVTSMLVTLWYVLVEKPEGYAWGNGLQQQGH